MGRREIEALLWGWGAVLAILALYYWHDTPLSWWFAPVGFLIGFVMAVIRMKM